MSATIEGLKEAFFQKEVTQLSENWQKYQAILKRLVDGEKVAPDEVGPVLELLGKSVSDIAMDVEHVKHRIAIRKRGEDAEQAKPKLLDAQARLDRLKADKQKFLDEIIPKIESAVVDRDFLSSVINAGSDVKADLFRSCRNPGLRKEFDAIELQLRTLSERERDIAFASQRSEPGAYAQELHELQTKKSVFSRRRSEVVAKMESE